MSLGRSTKQSGHHHVHPSCDHPHLCANPSAHNEGVIHRLCCVERFLDSWPLFWPMHRMQSALYADLVNHAAQKDIFEIYFCSRGRFYLSLPSSYLSAVVVGAAKLQYFRHFVLCRHNTGTDASDHRCTPLSNSSPNRMGHADSILRLCSILGAQHSCAKHRFGLQLSTPLVRRNGYITHETYCRRIQCLTTNRTNSHE